MVTKKWLALLAFLFIFLLCSTPYINKYDLLGWLSFGVIIGLIPYVLYKALPPHQLSLLLAISTPIPLGLAWGYWLGSYTNYYLDNEGIRTRAVVTATWVSRTRNGGTEKLYRIKFNTNSGYKEIFSHKNTNQYQVGDSVTVDYLPSEPNTYRIID